MLSFIPVGLLSNSLSVPHLLISSFSSLLRAPSRRAEPHSPGPHHGIGAPQSQSEPPNTPGSSSTQKQIHWHKEKEEEKNQAHKVPQAPHLGTGAPQGQRAGPPNAPGPSRDQAHRWLHGPGRTARRLSVRSCHHCAHCSPHHRERRVGY